MNNVYVTATLYRTYLTDGIQIYSTGQNITDGGVASTVFVKDSPF